MKILGGLLSPFVMRAALVARFKGHDLPVEMPEGGLKSEAYLALNPLGKMPCLVDGDFALPKSAVIAEYLDEVLPGPKLLPEEPKARARVRLLARAVDLYVAPPLTALFRAGDDPDAVAQAKSELGAALGKLEALRPAGATWLGGEAPSLADATAMPVFFFLDTFEPRHGTLQLLDPCPGLKRWWAMARATAEGQRMMAEQQAGLAAFRRA